MHSYNIGVPAPSEAVDHEGETAYCWLMTDKEKSHIADMLIYDGLMTIFLTCAFQSYQQLEL